LVVTTLTLAYLYFAEQLTIWYGQIPEHMELQNALLTGTYAPVFWTMATLVYVVPMTLTIPVVRRRPLAMMLIGIGINVGMYLERMLILIPPLALPRLPYARSSYFPSSLELTIMVGSAACAVLLYLLAAKFVPMISIWEEKEGLARG
jgi:molybdopterin-containing oxidoreductase family membrane subunit